MIGAQMLEVLVGVAILVGLLGIVVPVLPGSVLIAASVLVWAAVDPSPAAWWVFAAVAALLTAGAALTWVITARHTRAAGVRRRSLVLAGLAGIVGFFVVPVVGLFIFFAAGLYLAEYAVLGDAKLAWASARAGLTATGLGLLTELGLALTAAGVWLVAVLAGV